MLKHDEIMKLVAFETKNGPKEPAIGISGIIEGDARALAIYSGVAAEARFLFTAAPIMYQTLARVAAYSRQLLDEIENGFERGVLDRQGLEPLVAQFRAIENDALVAMQVATQGLTATAAAVSQEVRKHG